MPRFKISYFDSLVSWNNSTEIMIITDGIEKVQQRMPPSLDNRILISQNFFGKTDRKLSETQRNEKKNLMAAKCTKTPLSAASHLNTIPSKSVG